MCLSAAQSNPRLPPLSLRCHRMPLPKLPERPPFPFVRNGATVSKRRRIKAVSITFADYANLLILGTLQDPKSIRLFPNGPLACADH